MTASLQGSGDGRRTWSVSRDSEGHRTYKLKSLIRTTDGLNDGPQVVLNTPGLPAIGSTWAFGNDVDIWAFCSPEITVNFHKQIEGDPHTYWIAENTFTTIPTTRCQDTAIEDPLDEPDKISGNFARFQKALEKDRDGNFILSSSHEQIQGLQRDANRPTVTIEQNRLDLELDLFTSMIDSLNDSPIWGLNTGDIKLGPTSWTRKLFGICTFYFTRSFTFEIDFEGWNIEDIADTGYKKFDTEKIADTPTNRANPDNYVVIKDVDGENTPKKVLLDGNGSPLTDPTSPVFIDPVEPYDENNFLLLGIPISLV